LAYFHFISIYVSTALVEIGRFFSFLIHTPLRGLLGRGIRRSQGRYLHTERHKQSKRTQTSMPRVELEPTIPVFEKAKTVHALDRAAIVIGVCSFYKLKNSSNTEQQRNYDYKGMDIIQNQENNKYLLISANTIKLFTFLTILNRYLSNMLCEN
jgi:hypothetical protein